MTTWARRAARVTRFVPANWLGWLRRQWTRRIAWHLLLTVAVAAIALALFAKVGEDVFEHESGSVDADVRGWMLAHRIPIAFRVFTWITDAGASLPIGVAALLIGLWLWRARGRHVAAGAMLAPILAIGLFNFIKLFFARVRPIGALRFGLTTFAFPSGHATVSMAAAVTIAYVLWRERILAGAAAAGIAVVVPLLVGFSRVYLDVHWVTDVLGGWCVGLFVAGLSALMYERLRRDPVVASGERTPQPDQTVATDGRLNRGSPE